MPLLTIWRQRPAAGDLFVRKDLTGSWRVTRPVQCGFLSEWCVRRPYEGELIVGDLRGTWRVLAAPGLVRKDLSGRWRVNDLVCCDLTGIWAVVPESLVRGDLAGSWNINANVSSPLAGSWTVTRRANDMYPTCQLNGINLRVIRDFEPGGENVTYDEIRHYDGSLRVHDVRYGIYERRVDVMLTDSTPGGLDAQEEAIRSACKAGGSFVWQSRGPGGVLGPVKVDTVVPSDEPSFARNKTREALLRSYATLALRILPS